ncbi:MAG: glycosyltransferase family 2 protein [Spirochaetales bacterium]|jgi:glycosyltransferase involved in cell wall biosynthesis|nr:glycosyltransferase family 2 protein [Spirochaetales bacterium]
MRQGFLIPVYNHGKTALPIARGLAEKNLPIILVDDGSGEETKEYLNKTAAAFPQARLVTLEKNRGKGGAVSAGIRKARELGLTHVLQIDADGQHDARRAAYFLEQSNLHPGAVICSYPEYDEAAPASRKNGRIIANTWAKIVTLSPEIRDAMCGFRVYPVEPVWELIHRHHLDCRMGFDIEILVRLYWENIPLIFHPIRVSYPEDGISHFHAVRDNTRISWVFTRLFFGMLARFPILLRRACARRKQGLHR